MAITLNIQIDEHTPQHQLRAIQELLGFAINPAALHGNGATAASAPAAAAPRGAIPQPAGSVPLPVASAAALPALGPVQPIQIAAAKPAGDAETSSGKRGRKAASPEDKAVAAALGIGINEYNKQRKAGLLATAGIAPQPVPGSKDIGAAGLIAAPAIPAQAAPALSAKFGPAPGEAPAPAAAMPNGQTDELPQPNDPLYATAQDLCNKLSVVDQNAPMHILRNFVPGRSFFYPQMVPPEHIRELVSHLNNALPHDQRAIV